MAKSYPDIGTFTSGQILTAATMNDVGTNLDNLRVPPICILKRDSYTLANGSSDWVFDNSSHEEVDTDGMHSTSSNNTRITPTTAGVYLVTATIVSGPASGDSVTLQIKKNGVAFAGMGTTTAAGTYGALICVSGLIEANGSTDYFQAIGNPVTSRSCNVRFTANWVGQVS